MSAGSKLSVALIAVLLSLGLAACGGEDDSSSTATDTAASGRSAGQNADGGQAAGGPGDGSGANAGDGQGGGSGGSGSDGDDGSTASKDFTPRQHDDSGGGSDQYIVKGGDNSVQEFGEEADETDRNAAARALHNFLDARAQEAWDVACAYLSTEVRESLEMFAQKAQEAAEKQGKTGLVDDTGCAAILARLTNRAALPELRQEAEQADVGSLRLEGDRAFVIYTGIKGTVIAISVVEEDGGWKVASLAGTPLS